MNKDLLNVPDVATHRHPQVISSRDECEKASSNIVVFQRKFTPSVSVHTRRTFVSLKKYRRVLRSLHKLAMSSKGQKRKVIKAYAKAFNQSKIPYFNKKIL